MNRQHLLVGLMAALAVSTMSDARADLSADMVTYQAHQNGIGAGVRIGNAVTAFTNLPGIWAAATHRVECQEAAIRPPITGSRGWSDYGVFGPKTITVTSPATYTSVIGLSGWNSVMAGTRFDCVFTATGSARSSLLPISGGGTSIPLGGDVWEDSDYQVFSVIKPGTSGTGGCIV